MQRGLKTRFWAILLLMVWITMTIFPPSVMSKISRRPSNIKIEKKAPTSFSTKKDLSSTSGEFQINARSSVLMDGLSGEILYSYNPELRIPPASFVKILTLFIVFDAIRAGQLKMDELVTVSEKAWRTQGSKMFIKVGERVKVEDLIKGVAVASGNDACVALAEHISGSEEVFVSKLNEKAKQIGMKNSNFKNSHGMPDNDQYTTAMDMAILSKKYIEEHPEAIAFHSTTEFEYNGIKQGNRNTLLQKNIGVDGLKTGHIAESGYHLVATAKKDGQRMIAVVMGCDKVSQRANEAQKLLEYGFKNFSTIEAVKKDTIYGPLRVKWGKSKEVNLKPEKSYWVTVPKGKENLIIVNLKLPESVHAPVKKGQRLAQIIVQKEGKIINEIPLLASADIEKSIIPPWPLLLGIFLGILLIIFFLFFKKKRKVTI